MRSIAILLLTLGSACLVESPKYCNSAADCPLKAPVCTTHHCVVAPDGGGDAGTPTCRTSVDCPAAMPICDATMQSCRKCSGGADDSECSLRNNATPSFCSLAGTCGNCNAAHACMAPAAFCDPMSSTCRTCLNSDCASGVCDKVNQLCVAKSAVIYVKHGNCVAPNYCALQDALNAAKADATIKYIMVVGDATSYVTNASITSDITVIGPYADNPPSTMSNTVPGTLMSGTDSLPVIKVTGSAHVILDGLVLTRGTKAGGSGLSCDGQSVTVQRSVVTNNQDVGISVVSPCSITLAQSIVGNTTGTAGNAGGGLKITDAASSIQNTFIIGNGAMTSGIQAILYTFTSPSPPASLFINNTLADNLGAMSTAAMNCNNVGVGHSVDAVNTIFWRNNATTLGTPSLSETAGLCNPKHSASDDVSVMAGGMNIVLTNNNPPRFVNEPSDYHIQTGSPLLGMGTSQGAPTVDIDGDLRGAKIDIGADQL